MIAFHLGSIHVGHWRRSCTTTLGSYMGTNVVSIVSRLGSHVGSGPRIHRRFGLHEALHGLLVGKMASQAVPAVSGTCIIPRDGLERHLLAVSIHMHPGLVS